MKAEAILAIADLIVAHGVPAAIRLIQTLDAEKTTVADLQALKDLGLKPAQEYFRDPSRP